MYVYTCMLVFIMIVIIFPVYNFRKNENHRKLQF